MSTVNSVLEILIMKQLQYETLSQEWVILENAIYSLSKAKKIIEEDNNHEQPR